MFITHVPPDKGIHEELQAKEVVRQINDPTYNTYNFLMDIFNPLAEKGLSFIEISYISKKALAMVQMDEHFSKHTNAS